MKTVYSWNWRLEQTNWLKFCIVLGLFLRMSFHYAIGLAKIELQRSLPCAHSFHLNTKADNWL